MQHANDAVQTALQQLITKHGVGLCAKWPRLDGLLRDVCQGQHQREVNVLVRAAREGIVVELLREAATVDATLFHRLATRLVRRA